MKLFHKTSCFLLALLLLPSMTLAGFYKWTDANGKVHYTDKPHGDQSQEMNLKEHKVAVPVSTDNDSNTMSRAEKQQRLIDSMAEDRLQRKEVVAKRKAERKRSEKRCREITRAYNKDRQASALYDWDENNDRKFLSHQEREQHLSEMQREVDYWCK